MKKITRRTVLRASGLAAASLALSGCAPTGSACVGNGFPIGCSRPSGRAAAPPLLKAPKPLPRTPELRLKPRQKAPTAACPPTTPTPLPVSPAAAMAAWWV